MRSIHQAHRKFELDFTDERVTPMAGLAFVAQAAHRLGLLTALDSLAPCKQRDRGASDQENVLALLGCLTAGCGKLRDLDDLREDEAACDALGLDRVSGSRRMGEWLARVTAVHVASLQTMCRDVATRIAPAVITAEVATRGYVPLFLDGTCIEAYGKQFEGAARTYGDTDQYWMRGAFLGSLQVGGRLAPGREDPVGDWQTQLHEDIDPVIPSDTPVWVLMDNAYYSKEVVKALAARQWSWSMSVTDRKNKQAALRHLSDTAVWTAIGEQEDAADFWYRPSGWPRPVRFVVVRKWGDDDGQRLLFPGRTLIATSDDDLPCATVVARHRSKQGCENGFKGPLIEMDLLHPPTRHFHGNQLYYLCGLLAQQLLTFMQYDMLPTSARDGGLRPLIRDVVRTVGRLTRSGRRVKLQFTKRLRPQRVGWLLHACDVYDAWWATAPG